MPPVSEQLDLFALQRGRKVCCSVCLGKRTVPFWSLQGTRNAIGGKEMPCRTCGGTVRVLAR